jgi:lipopolysaccharide exporter
MNCRDGCVSLTRRWICNGSKPLNLKTEPNAGQSIGQRAVVGAGWMIAWRMMTRTLGLVSTLVLARLLVPGDFGLIAMATTFVVAVDSFSAVGIQDALVRRETNDRHMLNTAFTLQLLRALLTALVIFAAAIPVSHWFGEPRLLPIMLILGGVSAVGGLENIGIVEFRHGLRFDKEFKLLFLPRIISVAVTIGCAVAFRSYWALVAGVLSARVLRIVMTYVAHPFRPRLSLRCWRDLVGFSFWSWAISLAYLIWDRADLFVYGPVLGTTTLGVYMLAAEVGVLPITELVGPAATALFAAVARAQDRGHDSIAMAVPIALTLALVTIPLAIGVSATSGYVVASLLGPKWVAARPLIAIFSILCAFAPFSFVSMTVLMARGHMRRGFFGIASASATKLAVLLVLSSVTTQPELYAYAGLGLTALEAVYFLLQLNAVQRIDFVPLVRPAVRLLASTLATVTALFVTGLGWQPTAFAGIEALAIGMALGLASLVCFGAVQIVLWWFDGWRDGPESRLLEATRPLLRRLGLRYV